MGDVGYSLPTLQLRAQVCGGPNLGGGFREAGPVEPVGRGVGAGRGYGAWLSVGLFQIIVAE